MASRCKETSEIIWPPSSSSWAHATLQLSTATQPVEDHSLWQEAGFHILHAFSTGLPPRLPRPVWWWEWVVMCYLILHSHSLNKYLLNRENAKFWTDPTFSNCTVSEENLIIGSMLWSSCLAWLLYYKASWEVSGGFYCFSWRAEWNCVGRFIFQIILPRNPCWLSLWNKWISSVVWTWPSPVPLDSICVHVACILGYRETI